METVCSSHEETHPAASKLVAPSSAEKTPTAASGVLAPSSVMKPLDDDDSDTDCDPRSPEECLRFFLQQLVECSEATGSRSIPPVCMVIHPDLLGRIWGWKRLLPEVHGSVEWHDYKSYLVQYLEKKKDALNGEVALGDVTKHALKVATGEVALGDVVNNCIEAENKLVRTCSRFLPIEELCLIAEIKARAGELVQSVGEYPVAAATLLAITTEAELLCEMTIQSYGDDYANIAHQIRQAAFHLIRYGGSESTAVIAVMVGLVEESKFILDVLREDRHHASDLFLYETVMMRQGYATVLTRLDELCKAAGNAGTLTSAMKKLIGDVEKGDKKTSKSLHYVAQESGHAQKNNETGTKVVAFSPLRLDEARTHGWDNEDVQTQGMEKHSSHQHVQHDRHKKRSSHQRLENSGRQCQGTEIQHDHSKTINLSDNDEDEQENIDDNTSSRSGASRGRSKRRNDAKPVPHIEETMSDFMSSKREQAAAKAQNKCEGQEFSMTRCLAVLNDMLDLSDEVKIQASEVFKDPLNREIFLGYETRLRALWLTKEVKKLGTLSSAS